MPADNLAARGSLAYTLERVEADTAPATRWAGEMSEQVVDLDRVVAMSGLGVPDSYQAGREARAMLRLDELDQGADEVVLRVPAGVSAMASAFLIGLLQPSAERFGNRDHFFQHYRVDANPLLASQIRRAVEYSLLRDTKALVAGLDAVIVKEDP